MTAQEAISWTISALNGEAYEEAEAIKKQVMAGDDEWLKSMIQKIWRLI